MGKAPVGDLRDKVSQKLKDFCFYIPLFLKFKLTTVDNIFKDMIAICL